MNEQTVRNILRRLDALERTRPRLRVGEVTDVAPLDVALGGSSVSYEDVRSLGALAAGDRVAVLVSGNDLLVLGAVDRCIRFGTGTWNWSVTGVDSDTINVTHGLGHTPVAVVLTPSTAGRGITWEVASIGATTFSTIGRGPTSLASGSAFSFYWIAIG